MSIIYYCLCMGCKSAASSQSQFEILSLCHPVYTEETAGPHDLQAPRTIEQPKGGSGSLDYLQMGWKGRRVVRDTHAEDQQILLVWIWWRTCGVEGEIQQ